MGGTYSKGRSTRRSRSSVLPVHPHSILLETAVWGPAGCFMPCPAAERAGQRGPSCAAGRAGSEGSRTKMVPAKPWGGQEGQAPGRVRRALLLHI